MDYRRAIGSGSHLYLAHVADVLARRRIHKQQTALGEVGIAEVVCGCAPVNGNAGIGFVHLFFGHGELFDRCRLGRRRLSSRNVGNTGARIRLAFGIAAAPDEPEQHRHGKHDHCQQGF